MLSYPRGMIYLELSRKHIAFRELVEKFNGDYLEELVRISAMHQKRPYYRYAPVSELVDDIEGINVIKHDGVTYVTSLAFQLRDSEKLYILRACDAWFFVFYDEVTRVFLICGSRCKTVTDVLSRLFPGKVLHCVWGCEKGLTSLMREADDVI